MMGPGKLNRRITIHGIGTVDDPIYGPQPGQPIVIASRIAAEVQDVMPSRSESVEQGIALAANRTRIRFWYRSGIDSSMTVTVHGSVERTLQIIGGPAILGNREGIEIMCEEYSTQGGAQWLHH